MASWRTGGRRVQAARARWHEWLERDPARYLAYMQRRFPQHRYVGPSSLVCLEGPHGSATSYARAAVAHANPGADIASHLHSAAHLARAVELGVPALAILRDPRDSVPSLVLRFPDQHPQMLLLRHLAFSRGVAALGDRIVTIAFEDVTTRPGAVVRLLNERFRSSIVAVDDNDPRELAAVAARIGQHAAWTMGFEAAERMALPSEARQQRADAVRADLSARWSPLLDRCVEAWRAVPLDRV